MMDSILNYHSPLQMEMTSQALSPPRHIRPTTTKASSLAVDYDGPFPVFPFTTSTAGSSTERFVLKPRALPYNRYLLFSPYYHTTTESPMLVDDEHEVSDEHEESRYEDETSTSKLPMDLKAMDMNEEIQLLQVLGRVNNLMRGDSTGSICSAFKRRNSNSAPSA